MRMWFTEDAAPHLAEATARNYLQVANTWIRPIAGSWPLRAFEKPRAVNELLRQAQVQGVERLDASGRPTGQVDTAHRPTVDPIRKILSSALIRGDRLLPTGQRVVSGGGASISDEQIAITQATSDRTGWLVAGIDLYDDGGEYLQAQALCAPAAPWRRRSVMSAPSVSWKPCSPSCVTSPSGERPADEAMRKDPGASDDRRRIARRARRDVGATPTTSCVANIATWEESGLPGLAWDSFGDFMQTVLEGSAASDIHGFPQGWNGCASPTPMPPLTAAPE
jgi:hypothetical protein